MKNPWEVLQQKETDLANVKSHIVALHIAIALLREKGDPWPEDLKFKNVRSEAECSSELKTSELKTTSIA